GADRQFRISPAGKRVRPDPSIVHDRLAIPVILRPPHGLAPRSPASHRGVLSLYIGAEADDHPARQTRSHNSFAGSQNSVLKSMILSPFSFTPSFSSNFFR